MVIKLEKGKLYIVATPIGNLNDITLRAINTLKEADIIVAEDTRHSLKLLNHLGISKPLISYYRHTEEVKYEKILEKVWKEKLSKEEQRMFLNAGRNLLSDDMYYQQEEMRQLSVFLNERICQMKKEYTGKKKVVLVFCLCMGTLAVILLF